MSQPALSARTVPLRDIQAEVTFRRSARAKRISLRVDPVQGGIVITLPPRATPRAGLALLQAHEDWAANKLAALPQALRFLPGARVPVRGVAHVIEHRPQARGGAWIEAQRIVVTGEVDFLPRRVTDCLKHLARRDFSALAQTKAENVALHPKTVRIKDTRSRWGSCAPDGTLAFSWRLICAPDFVQDYVVAHEVAHLRHMNHGPQFWALAKQLSPHGTVATAWLHRFGAALLRIG